MEKGCFVLAGIDTDGLLQAVDLAIEMCVNGDFASAVPDYIDKNVSSKVVKIIQSYVGVVDRFVWRNEGT